MGFFDKEHEATPPEQADGATSFFDKAHEAAADAAPASDLDNLKQAAGMVVDQILGGAKKVGGTLMAPLAEMDKLTGAPLRAGMGAIQNGADAAGAGNAALDQVKAGLPGMGENGFVKFGQILPTTPTGADIATKGMTQYGFKPADARAMSGIPGAMTDAALDVTNLIPTDLATDAVRGVGKVFGKGIDAAAGAAGALERGVAKPLFGVGSVLTGGNINYDKALRAASVLKSYELMAPGTKDFGALASSIKEVGEARQALGSAKLTVPGSHAAAQDAINLVDGAIARTMPTLRPNAESLKQFIQERMFETTTTMEPVPLPEIQQAYLGAKNELNRVGNEFGAMKSQYEAAIAQGLGADALVPFHEQMSAANQTVRQAHDAVDQLAKGYQSHLGGKPVFTRPVTVTKPKDLTLDEVDDVITNMDNLVYTGIGNERLPKRIWTPAVKQSRRILNDSLNSIPEGMLFQDLKTQNEGLQTASKGRSKLLDALGTGGIISGGSTGIIGMFTGTDLSIPALATMAAGMSIKPGTYYKIMGAAKLPGDMARAVQAAADSGKLAVMRDTLSSFSKKYPVATEGLIRGMALAASKPDGQQVLSAYDIEHLSSPKSFDPEVIAQTAQDIKDDPHTPSVMKARLLSDIAENGYVLLPNHAAQDEMPAEEAPPAPQVKPDIGHILRSLKTGTGK